MKPFCSGGTDDLDAIRLIQGEELEPDLLNPYYFPQPLAPAVAAEKSGTRINLRKAVTAIKRAAAHCECLLVEGAGGLLVPVTRRRTILDLIRTLECEVIVVAPNKLGTLNHSLLTLETLRRHSVKRTKLIFFDRESPDPSAEDNLRWVNKMAVNIEVLKLPWIPKGVKRERKKIEGSNFFKKTLARICAPDNVCPVVRTAETKQRNERLKKRK